MSSQKSRNMSVTTLRDDQSVIDEKMAIEELGDDDDGALLVFKSIKPDCWGNLPVSLFWEEKLVLLLKFYQFLGFTLIVFFEQWPNRWQELSGYFCAATFNFYMLGGDDSAKAKQKLYYNMLTTFDPNFWTYMYTYTGLVATILLGLVMFFNKRFNSWTIRSVVRQVKTINAFKAYMWFVEIVQFPILVNLVQTGVCKYSTDKIIYKSVNCYSRDNWSWLTQTLPAQLISYEEDDIDVANIKGFIWWMTFSAGAAVLIYNLLALAHIYSESVSIVDSERFIIKKEVEFCLGVSYNWLTQYYFYFSSYRPGVWK